LILRNAGGDGSTYAGHSRYGYGEETMHPILRDMLMEPVGWLTISGALIILGIPVFTAFFIRRKMHEDERDKR